MANKTVFTIGHSTHKIEYLIDLLNKFDINCVIDVRSSPYSRIAPQFNKPSLNSTLRENNIVYMHFEKEFGARHTKPSLLDENSRVDFDKVRETTAFKQGVERLKNGLERGYKIALMCSEANPFDCHRFSMISYQLVREGMDVNHVLQDGNSIANSELEDQLLKKYHKQLLPQSTFFEVVTRETQIEDAYRLRGKDVAFSALIAHQEESIGS
ncbi:MAG: DUF488 domain-containing protein [Anaerolineae bacterium]|nr:DUF488 domain-containing protein [Anaerolineae bacterium]